MGIESRHCKHSECKHEKVKYCKECQKVYCQKCGKQWFEMQWYYPYHFYPTYPVYQTQPYITYTSSGTTVDTGGNYGISKE